MIRRLLLSAAGTAALAACTTAGPDYVRPEGAAISQPEAQGRFVSGDRSAFTPTPVPGDWWRLYKAPTLDQLVTEALRANTDLRVAAANIAKANAALDLTEDQRSVQTNIQGGPGYGQRSAEEELLPGSPLPRKFVYSLSGSVAYQLDLAGQISRAVEAAQADVAATQAAYDSVRITVVANTTRAYLDACSAGREIAVAQKALALQQRSTELTRRLVRGGRGISVDVTRSLAQEAQLRATVPDLLARRQVALYRLAVLTGKPPASFDRAVATCAAEPHLDRPIPIGDGQALLRRRPDVRRAEMELRGATARIGVATAELYPRISLGASVGSIGAAENFLASDTFKFSLGPLISWEFPNRRRVRARIAGAEADADAAYARFDGTVLTALEETERALTLYGRDLDRRAALADAVTAATKAVADEERLFKAGRQGSLAVLDANRTLTSAQQSLAAADSQIAADQVALFLALGGGWQSGGATPLVQE